METIQHFSHHHPLSTTLVLPNNLVGAAARCRICWKFLEGQVSDHYGCKECGFYIHKLCAVFPHELQHPSHPKHPLLLQLHRYEKCANCSNILFDFKYKCPHCDDQFYLCPECAFLPLTKKAENHNHPLTLVRKLLPFQCDACGKEDMNQMHYCCPTCLFIVHPKCTSLPALVVRQPTIKAAIHAHPLTLGGKVFLFTCDACGNEGKGMFYFCATCSFVAHLDCAQLLPSIVKVRRHKHPLNLIYSFPVDQYPLKVCQLCVKTVDANYWVYRCSEQDFIAHLHCATSKEEKDETFVPNSKEDDRDKSIDLVTKSEISSRESQVKVVTSTSSSEHHQIRPPWFEALLIEIDSRVAAQIAPIQSRLKNVEDRLQELRVILIGKLRARPYMTTRDSEKKLTINPI